MFSLATIPLSAPVTLTLSSSRPRVLTSAQLPKSDGSVSIGSGQARTFERLDCCFLTNPVTRTIHAQIATLPRPLLIYGPADFQAAAADTPEQHAERVLQCLGKDPAATLQALCDGTTLPPAPPRVPREIANWRAKAILANAGLLSPVETSIASLPDPERSVVTLAWQGGAPLARRGKTVLALAPALGLTDGQLDALFIAAEALEV